MKNGWIDTNSPTVLDGFGPSDLSIQQTLMCRDLLFLWAPAFSIKAYQVYDIATTKGNKGANNKVHYGLEG